jgi:hypothetical protein
MMMRLAGRRLACCVMLVAAHRAAGAQAPPLQTREVPTARAPVQIVVDQLTGMIEVRSPEGTLTQSWDPSARTGRSPLAQVPARRPVDVVIKNANPLLYRYDVQTSVVVKRPLPTCATLGSRMASASFLTSFATVATSAQPVLAQGMAQLFQAPAPLLTQEATTRGEALLSRSALVEVLATHRAPVERYVQFIAAVKMLAVTLDDSLAAIAELGETQPLDSLLNALTASLDRNAPGLSQAARVPLTLREQDAAVRPHLAALETVASAIARGNVDDAAGSSDAASELTRLMASAKSARDNLAASYRMLQAQLVRIENAKARTRQVFSSPESDDIRRIAIDVQPSAEYPAVFRSRTGRQELYTEPVVSLLCQLSFGVAFMTHAPSYTVNNGVLQNRETDQRAGVAALIHVAAAQFPLFGAIAGFGFGSEGAPDLYSGVSIRALDPLMVNLGAVWQRGQQLPAGVREGQALNDPSVVQSLSKRYAPSFFWGVSIAR